jgi:site-specific DNA-adenine methylase
MSNRTNAEGLAPLFQYAGGKRRVAPYVWRALGNVRTYIEPFAGSAAVLLGRPSAHLGRDRRVEILNDASGRIVNMYRALAADPDALWRAADGLRSSIDGDARMRALDDQDWPSIEDRLRADPCWFDLQIAGWQLYVLRYAIHSQAALGGRARYGRPNDSAKPLSRAEVRAVHARLRTAHLVVLCDDWSKAVTPRLRSESPVGIFLDPPYLAADRRDRLYAHDDRGDAHRCREWAIAHGNIPDHRIILAGYEEEGAPPGWTEVRWSSASGGDSRTRERLWLSPHCLVQSADVGQVLTFRPELR